MEAWKQETESVDCSLSQVYYNTDLRFKTSLAWLGVGVPLARPRAHCVDIAKNRR